MIRINGSVDGIIVNGDDDPSWLAGVIKSNNLIKQQGNIVNPVLESTSNWPRINVESTSECWHDCMPLHKPRFWPLPLPWPLAWPGRCHLWKQFEWANGFGFKAEFSPSKPQLPSCVECSSSEMNVFSMSGNNGDEPDACWVSKTEHWTRALGEITLVRPDQNKSTNSSFRYSLPACSECKSRRDLQAGDFWW